MGAASFVVLAVLSTEPGKVVLVSVGIGEVGVVKGSSGLEALVSLMDSDLSRKDVSLMGVGLFGVLGVVIPSSAVVALVGRVVDVVGVEASSSAKIDFGPSSLEGGAGSSASSKSENKSSFASGVVVLFSEAAVLSVVVVGGVVSGVALFIGIEGVTVLVKVSLSLGLVESSTGFKGSIVGGNSGFFGSSVVVVLSASALVSTSTLGSLMSSFLASS